MTHFNQAEFILYVKSQEVSTRFYQAVLQQKPVLNVPGMTEFELAENCKLGLMSNDGIAKILNSETPHPDKGQGIPRCELYLKVEDLPSFFENALECGALLVSPILDRDWGDRVGYLADPDGHIIAFAETVSKTKV